MAAIKSTRSATLANDDDSTKKTVSKVEKRMNEIFHLLGVSDVDEVSSCLKAAILKGHIRIEDPKSDPAGEWGLDQPVITDKCITCNATITCRVRDVLYQPDYAGTDYEDGGEEATFRCHNHNTEGCAGIYVTRMCYGNPAFDSGKFHNHCDRHSRYGYCIGDYREQHCGRCGKHFFAVCDCKCDCYNSEEDEDSSDEDGNLEDISDDPDEYSS